MKTFQEQQLEIRMAGSKLGDYGPDFKATYNSKEQALSYVKEFIDNHED